VNRRANLLTVVQIVADRTLTGHDPQKEKQMLEARPQALAWANKQLTELDWNSLMLGKIIRSKLAVFSAR